MTGVARPLVVALAVVLAGAPAPVIAKPLAPAATQDARAATHLVREMRTHRRDGDARAALQAMRAAPPDVRANVRVVGQWLLALLDQRRFDDARAMLGSLRIPEAQRIVQIRVAELHLALVAGDVRGALEGADALLREHADHLDVLALEVRALAAAGDFRGADRALEAFAPDSSAWLRAELYAELLDARAAALMADDAFLGDALGLLETALEEAPHRGDVRARYADALVRWQRYDEAEEQIALGLESPGPDETALLRQRGDLYRETGRVDEAAAAYEALLEAQPRDLAAVLGLARCRARQRDKAAAIALVEDAVTWDRGVDALVVLAELHESEGELEASEAALRRVLERKPDNLRACWRLSRVLARQGEMEEVDELVARYEARKEELLARTR